MTHIPQRCSSVFQQMIRQKNVAAPTLPLCVVKKKHAVIPIVYVIGLATLVSTCSSMAGGLLMYFESLKSLEHTVSETSASEVEGLRSSIRAVTSRAKEIAAATATFGFSNRVVSANVSTDVWSGLLHAQQYTAVRTSDNSTTSIGLVVVNHESDEASNSYHLVFRSLTGDGRLEYFAARYLQGRDDQYWDNATNSLQLRAQTYRLNDTTGDYLEPRYTFNAAMYKDFANGWDPRAGGLPDGWDTGTGSAAAEKWRNPHVWRSSDGHAYSYGAIDFLFKPPPPPHPWSNARLIIGFGAFFYGSWARCVQDYVAEKQDRHVLLYDTHTELVYASTEGTNLVKDDGCPKTELADLTNYGQPGCAYFVHNTSYFMKDAHRTMLGEPSGVMLIRNLAGEDYFIRKQNVLNDVEIIWMRPTASIQGKVRAALVFLMIFTALVLVFDSLMTLVEIVYVALPLRQLERVFKLLGAMKTKEAALAIAQQRDGGFVVKEINGLLCGLAGASSQLHLLKDFMAHSALCSSSESEAHSSSNESRPPESAVMQADLPVCEARTRPVCVAYFNLRGFHKWLDNSQDAALTGHTRYVDMILDLSKERRGIVDDLCGDRVSISFNTVIRCCDPVQKGAMLTLHAVKQLSGTLGGVSAAVCSGPALVGNVGCTGLKKFAILGSVVGNVRCLLRCAGVWNTGPLCNAPVATRISYLVQIRHIVPAIVGGEKTLVSELVKLLTLRNEEWMYQMTDDEHVNPHAANNAVLEGVYAQELVGLEAQYNACTYPVAKALYSALLDKKKSVPLNNLDAVPSLPGITSRASSGQPCAVRTVPPTYS